MKILITGSTGLIGMALASFLRANGHSVIGLRRAGTPLGRDEASWDPAAGSIGAAALEGAEAIVHLAGESIAAHRWTAVQKRRILESRVGPTRALSTFLSRQQYPPKSLITASAIGFYGDRSDEWLDESSAPGTGFLADVCTQWEAATEPAKQKGIRVVNTRFGIILSRHGGALRQMLLPFKLGVGGLIGSGRQYWSWVAIDDVVGAIHHALTTKSVAGPINVVSPNPVRNREFTRTLAKALKRPGIVPMPAFIARLFLGEMADELLLSSARIKPARLRTTGYTFKHTELEDALRHVLKS